MYPVAKVGIRYLLSSYEKYYDDLPFSVPIIFKDPYGISVFNHEEK